MVSKEGWSDAQHKSLTTLIEIEPQLSEMVDDRESRLKVWKWTRSMTTGFVEFLKWAVMIGGAVGLAKGILQGWIK